MTPLHKNSDEETPLLRPSGDGDGDATTPDIEETREIQFSDGEDGNPRAWNEKRKITTSPSSL